MFNLRKFFGKNINPMIFYLQGHYRCNFLCFKKQGKTKTKQEITSIEENIILCSHCKRTKSNSIEALKECIKGFNPSSNLSLQVLPN